MTMATKRKQNKANVHNTSHDDIDEDQKLLDRALEKKVERIRCGCAVDELQQWVDDMTEKHTPKIANSISNMSLYIHILIIMACVFTSIIIYIIIDSG